MFWFALGLLLFAYLFYHLVVALILLLLYWCTSYFDRQQQVHRHHHLPPQSYQKQLQVIRLCLFSRLGITLLAIAANFLPDHEADAFRNDLLKQYPAASLTALDRAIFWCAEPFTRWDAQYFLAIAHDNKYRNEQMLAFFPMYPQLVRYAGLGLQSGLMALFPSVKISFVASLMLAGYLVNLVAFTLAGWFLYKLTYMITHSRPQSYRAVKIFAFNPASIFFTAFYTESLFSCLTFGALFFLYRYNLSVVSSVFIALSAYTRSNGIITFPFIAFYNLIHMLSMAKGRASPFSLSFRFVTVTAFEGLICFVPPFLFQFSAWEQFCGDVPSSTSSIPVWCQSESFSLPYMYVQGKYWENGFLRYYQIKKLPNFLMAAPTLVLVIYSTIQYLYRNRHHLKHLVGDHFSSTAPFNPQQSITALTEHSSYIKEYKRLDIFQQPCLLPFALHALFLSLFCLFFMHVEVATRFLFSASPWPMWALVQLGTYNWLGRYSRGLVTTWLLGYCVFGTTLFANFLPFT